MRKNLNKNGITNKKGEKKKRNTETRCKNGQKRRQGGDEHNKVNKLDGKLQGEEKVVGGGGEKLKENKRQHEKRIEKERKEKNKKEETQEIQNKGELKHNEEGEEEEKCK